MDEVIQNALNQVADCSSITADDVRVDGADNAVLQANCHAPAGYIAEFLTSTGAAPKGVAVVFSGTTPPAAGDYTVEDDAAQIDPGEAYIEYFDTATAWHGTIGSVTVTENGAERIYEFCELPLTATPADIKIVSLRGTCL